MKKWIATAACIFSLTNLVKAQAHVNEELKNILTASLNYYPKVKETQQSVQLAEEKLKLTELNKYPDFTLDASYAYVQPKIQVAFGEKMFQFAPEHNYGAAVNAVYTLADFGRLKANIEKSKFELQASKHAAAQLRANLFYQISQVYYQIVFAKKAIDIQNEILDVLNENKKVIESQLKNGNAIKLDLLTIQSKIDNEQNKKIDLETNLKKLSNLLSYASGIETVNGNQFNFELQKFTIEEALQKAALNNATLAIANDKINIAKSDIAISKLGFKPYIGLKGSVGSKNGYLPAIQDQRFNYNAGLGFSVPLFNGGKTKQLVKIQEKGLSVQETNASAIVHEIEKDIKAALIDIQSNEQRIKNAASQIEQAALAQKLSSAKLLNGTTTPIELTSTNSDYQKALFNQLQYEYQLCIAKIELARLMGIVLLD